MRSLVFLFTLASCLPQVGPPIEPDAGVTAGGVSAMDGGSTGGGAAQSCSDTMQNGAETDVDCGGTCGPCALNARCGTALDCDSGLCSGSRCVAPQAVCGNAVRCTSWTDLTDSPSKVVRFPSGNDRYTPACVRVRFGQSVTFQGGDFGSHPMSQACGPVILPAFEQSSGTSASITFDKALGVFGYFCTHHGSASGSGMAGAIEVVR
ncbi:MAG: hypothetical protein ABTQ32_38625 [Myxococcaceae bacterium]